MVFSLKKGKNGVFSVFSDAFLAFLIGFYSLEQAKARW